MMPMIWGRGGGGGGEKVCRYERDREGKLKLVC